ncbi:hypothetical protein L916_07748, partial [Phytophthora nicotianae]
MVSSASAAACRGGDAGSDAQAGSAVPVRTSQRQAAKHVATLKSVEAAIDTMALPLLLEDGASSSVLGSADCRRSGPFCDGGSNNSGDGSRRSVIRTQMIARAAHGRGGKVAKSQHRREVYELRVRQAAHACKLKKSKKPRVSSHAQLLARTMFGTSGKSEGPMYSSEICMSIIGSSSSLPNIKSYTTPLVPLHRPAVCSI